MRDKRFYSFLHRQIPVMMVLSLFPGLGYIFLSWLHDIHVPALIWYSLIVVNSIWGYRIYKKFNFEEMSKQSRESWYREMSYFFYAFFLLWAIIFIIYVKHDTYNLHYIAIFTELGASVVAAALLFPDRKLFVPTIFILMVPLIVYFFNINDWYGYVLTIFASIFTWVLLYAANSSHNLLKTTSYQASHDLLTGLYNRYFFINSLQQMMNTLKESNQYSYLLLIDLDHFKIINDSLGHDVGDRILQKVSTRLRKQIPVNNMVARLGGDEFIITGSEFNNKEQCRDEAVALSNTLLNALKQTYIIDLNHLYLSSSIGVSLINPTNTNANSFIKEADIAMYEVKAKGRDGVFVFSDEMSKRVEKHLEIEQMLHFAIEKNEITLHFQPQLNKDQKIIGVEALARWNNHKLGNIPPVDFIPIAEQTGIIIELGNYILKSAFTTLVDWEKKGYALEQISINISMRQIFHYNFIHDITALCEQYLDSSLRSKIIFEITETIVAEEIGKVIGVMRDIKKLGIRFSMDDFGTGYSSLSYLKQLPIDEIKIDRSFVNKLDHDKGDQEMVNTILNMAKIFKLNIVAEGVETETQFNFLEQHNCDIFQGYYFSMPLEKDKFEAFYTQQAG
ncbi:MAG: EAL domain-containing protein [Gammaproteobacteria bacterium]|nr:EAL domain-containing protein [Gammaproteobacteria bacterium]